MPNESGLDLYPTICDYAGIEVPDDLRGRSVNPLLEGSLESDWRDYVVTEISLGNWVDDYHRDTFHKVRMLRTQDYKYVVFDEGDIREQLTDMINDPDEMINLAPDPAFEDVLVRHRNYLDKWITLTEDSFIPIK